MKKFEKNKQVGMLLIEVLLSILIFSFGLLGLVGLQAISTKNAVGAEDRTIAASLANDLVTLMWIRKSVDVTTGDLNKDYLGVTTGTAAQRYVGWKTKVANSLRNGTDLVTTDVTSKITTITINWITPATSGGSSTAITHKYTTQFSM